MNGAGKSKGKTEIEKTNFMLPDVYCIYYSCI